MSSIHQDVRLALRGFVARPGYSAALVGTLALGIGASTAMFSLVDAALIRSLPFRDPDALVVVWGVAGPERNPRGSSLVEALDWRAMNSTLTDLSVYDQFSLNLRAVDGVERVNAELVSASYFPLLGARAALGRTFLPEEDRVPDAAPVIVISQDLWQRRFNGDSSAIGRTLTLNDRPFTVVGVMHEGFHGLSFDTHVWVPSMAQSVYQPASMYTSRGSRWLMTLGRLKPGVDSATAQRDLDAVGARLAEQYPSTNSDRSAQIQMLRNNYLGQTRSLITTVFGAVLLLLLVACANVAGLQLVRTTARDREMSLRLALGAGRGRLVRQLLVEGAIVGLAGGVAGAILAAWILQGALPALPEGLLPRWVDPSVDLRALAFTFVVALAAGSFSAFVPALRGTRADLTTALKSGVRSAASGLGRIRRPGAQQLLVVAEVAVALVLLTGTALMVRSLRAQLDVPPGFEAAGVTIGRISLPRDRYPYDARMRFASSLVERLEQVPGVVSASVSSDLPMTGGSSASQISVPGRDGGQPIRHYRHFVTPGFFETLGIALRAGRDFDERDHVDAPPVVIVSEAMARRYWPGEEAVGQRFRLGDETGPEVTIVGVAENARFRDLTTNLDAPASEPDVYYPYTQRTDADVGVAVRTSNGTPVSVELLQAAVSSLDAALPLYLVGPLEAPLQQQSASPRFGSFALSAVSLFAILLAGLGLYGVIAFVVGLSRAEIAIRMALGADARRVLRLIVGNGLTLVGVGVLLGVAGSLALAPLLSEQLFQVSARDPVTLVSVAALVVTVAVVACWLPARRTLRVEPNAALRSE
jgi:predicted permease